MYYKSDKVSHDEKQREEGRDIQKVRNMERKHNGSFNGTHVRELCSS
jgi:hypothetical protein